MPPAALASSRMLPPALLAEHSRRVSYLHHRAANGTKDGANPANRDGVGKKRGVKALLSYPIGLFFVAGLL